MGQGKRRLGRVDLQVSLLAAALVAVSVLCMYFYQYTLAHGDMLRSLENKVQGIYEYVESIAEEEDFTAINRREDEAGAQYRGLKEELERVRKIAGVRYLYTAKQAQDGNGNQGSRQQRHLQVHPAKPSFPLSHCRAPLSADPL